MRISNFQNPITEGPFLPYFLYLKKNYAKFYSTGHLFRHLNYFKESQGKSYESY